MAGSAIAPTAGASCSARGRAAACAHCLQSGETVRVRASIRSRFYDGEIEVVDAFHPGREPPRKCCWWPTSAIPSPGAHDNASGAGALIEAAQRWRG